MHVNMHCRGSGWPAKVASSTNIFVERLWRSLRYECVNLHARETGSEAKAGVRKWMEFYNHKRPHSALGGMPPAVVYSQRNETTNPDQQVQGVA
jgi:putative transposase